jgi:transposase
VVRSFTRRKPVRGPLSAHLPRERVVIPGPAVCPCCGGALSKLGETITESLESVPRQWKVIQTVREKFVCRACETITQPPAPFHPIARGRAGPNLLAMILDAEFSNHQPLNRQSEVYAREGIDLDVSTLADWMRYRVRRSTRSVQNARNLVLARVTSMPSAMPGLPRRSL